MQWSMRRDEEDERRWAGRWMGMWEGVCAGAMDWAEGGGLQVLQLFVEV